MNKFMEFLEHRVSPIAEKIEKQRHISTIKNAMISLITVLLVGSISLIVGGLAGLFPQGSAVANWVAENGALLNLPFTFTFGLLTVYATISIAFYHSKALDIAPLHPMFAAMAFVLVLCVKFDGGALDIQFLDSRGLFVAIFGGIFAVEFISFCFKHNLTLRIPGLPDMIGKTFESIFPVLFIILIGMGINSLCGLYQEGIILPELLTKILAPAVTGIDSMQGVFLISLIEMIFWFLGLNGYAILIGFTLPFMTHYLAANAANYAAGLPLEFIFTEQWWGYFLACTGSGITGAIAILGLFSKSKQLKAAGKASIIPAMFNISEPVVYGFPVAFNPYFFIPFVFGTPILGAITWKIFDLGWVAKPMAAVGGVPTPICQYLITMDWKAAVLAILIIAIAILMYYPFFKLYEKSVLAQENESEYSGETDFDEEFDFEL